MKRTFKIEMALLILMSFAGLSAFGETQEKGRFEEFRIIWERNIFDPSRREPQREVRTPRKEETKPEEHIRLLGALLNGKDANVFFEGSSSSYNGEWKRGDVIAGFRISQVQTNGVVLEKKDQKIDLPVGSVIIRTEGDAWRIGDSSESFATIPEKEKSSNAISKDAGTNDILKRLMERRRQETGQ
ncbi:hypothetical protein JW926_18550 [Candidatus Sumerlaeota bacterium]|nr:hypothetical protein [Candidatus Sumerlaeota bacterium]